MHYTKKKSSPVKAILIVLLALLVLAGAGAALYFSGIFSPSAEPPVVYEVQGNADVLRVEPDGGLSDESSLREYYAGAVAYARENGLNTILYKAKDGFAVYWRDGIFPAVPAVVSQDGFFSKLDPLALLMEAAEGSGVQIWLEVDPYTETGYESGMKGKAAKLLEAGAANLQADSEYEDLLAESLFSLPDRYGIAGIVFSGEGLLEDGFSSLLGLVRGGLDTMGYTTRLGIIDEKGALKAQANSLQAAGVLDFALMDLSYTDTPVAEIESWTLPVIAMAPAANSSTLGLFLTARSENFAGTQFAGYPGGTADNIAVLNATIQPAARTLPAGFEVAEILAVTNPEYGYGTTAERVFIMGTSDPAQPLYMDGAEVERQSTGGAFGILVELELGENRFTFSQGDTSVEYLVKRNTPSGGSGGATQSDGTSEAAAGQVVRVTSQYTTGWKEPGNGISETFYRGATFVVQGSRQITRSGKLSWAYQIASGDWVYAEDCEWISGDGASTFTGIAATADEGGEWLELAGGYTPGAYVSYDEQANALQLTMYNTSVSGVEGFSSGYVKSASVQAEGNAAVLTLSLERIWGYSLEYQDGKTLLYLKKAPELTGGAAKPLAGVHIMLDPGHGGTDDGLWAGIINPTIGQDGPIEKNLNLVMSEVLAYRLEQLGATVTMTREDDTYSTIYERLAMENEVKPDMYISIHHNALDPDRDLNEVSGTEVYYYHPYATPNSELLAEKIVDAVTEATGRSNRGAKWSSYVVTRTTVCPSILCEMGFLGNAAEFEDLASTEGIYASAWAMADAVVDFFYS